MSYIHGIFVQLIYTSHHICTILKSTCKYIVDQTAIRSTATLISTPCVNKNCTFIHKFGLDRQTTLRSASKGDLVVPRTSLKLGECAFRVAAPRLWNELPSDIRKASILATFKKHLKTFLFCEHYGTILEQ